jgi:cytochrome c oxidase cbb3-type subunit 2
LAKTKLNSDAVAPRMRALRKVGVPYTDADIANASKELQEKTEEDALVAYLQVLGTAIKNKQ